MSLHVQPNARKSGIVGLHGDALKVKIAAPAADNRANAALIEFLSEALGVSKSAVVLRHGATSRRKVVEIAASPELASRVRALAESRITNHESRITRRPR
ncbi:MAG: YggU family protein [Betaproteobacteria bacterium]|nr:YggU family protein [Betaproteobacteria bacterium]